MTLPQPDDDARAHSARLVEYICQEASASGWLSFARYMELALYAPGLGYYSAGARKFGAEGDFITAPQMSPVFAQTLARQAREVMDRSAPMILEAGAGSGALAAELLLELARLGALPDSYAILELSGELRDRQAATLKECAPHLADRVVWLERLPGSFSGLVLANEVLDAMPVHVVHWLPETIAERGVAVGVGGGLEWVERAAEGAVLSAAEAIAVEPPYLSEINLAAEAWITEWARILGRGAILLIDYGFPRHEYYHPQRSAGTLMCHYRHHAHEDPFFLPGLNDITAHLDFTALADAGTDAGLDLLGYCSQAQFLINCGLTEVLARHDPQDTAVYLPIAAAVNKLVSAAEMGELFKVMAFGRGLDLPLIGFSRGERSHTL